MLAACAAHMHQRRGQAHLLAAPRPSRQRGWRCPSSSGEGRCSSTASVRAVQRRCSGACSGRSRRWRRRRDQAILLQIVTGKKAAQTLIPLLVQPALFTPAGLVPRVCPSLQVGQPVERLATVYAEQGSSKADLCGRAPASAAAAAILLASQELAGRGGAGRGPQCRPQPSH